jgi:hypothetical protein
MEPPPLYHDAVGAETETGMKGEDEIQEGVVNARTIGHLNLEERVPSMRIIDAHRHQRLGNPRLPGGRRRACILHRTMVVQELMPSNHFWTSALLV